MSPVESVSSVVARINAIEVRFGAPRTSLDSPATAPAASGSAAPTFDALLDAQETGASEPRAWLATTTAGYAAASAAPLDLSAPVSLDPSDRVNPSVPYAAAFDAAGDRYGISPRLLAAVAKVESRYRPDAVSSAGAVGLMQLMPSTAQGLGVDPHDPVASIDGAARLLRDMRDRFGSIELALGAYNVGPGTISRAGGITAGSQAERYVNAVLGALEATP